MSSLLWHAPAFRRAQLLRPAATPLAVRAMASSMAAPLPPPIPVTRIHFPTIDSTNSYAKAHARELRADGVTVITTDQQTAGRGRLSRTWISAAGGDDITMTFAFHVPPAALRTAYQLSPLLAVVARRAFAPHGVDVGIKWPNDIIVGGCRKMGGILAEMEALPGGSAFLAVLGVGININSMPADLGVARPVWPLTTLRAETGGAVRHNVKALTDSMVDSFAAALPVYLAQGFAPFQAEYEAASVLLGRRVRFTVEAGVVVEGVVTRIGADGTLYVRLASGGGEERGFLSGEVSGIELAPGQPLMEGHPD